MANPGYIRRPKANIVDPLGLVPMKAVVFIDAMSVCQSLLQEILAQHRLRDRDWRGAKVVPLRRLGAGE